MVVKPGRSFTHHLIQAMKLPKHPNHYVRLNQQCKADIAWWHTFLSSWNGSGFYNEPKALVVVTSDASGSWECGAFARGTSSWFQLEWPAAWHAINIAVKELVPIVVSSALWGGGWKNKEVKFVCDNMAVVTCLSRRSARNNHLVHLLRCLFFFEAHFSFSFRAEHLPGKDNIAADALSRNNLSHFFSIYPQACPAPQHVPNSSSQNAKRPSSHLQTSSHWNRLFKDTLQAVLPSQP